VDSTGEVTLRRMRISQQQLRDMVDASGDRGARLLSSDENVPGETPAGGERRRVTQGKGGGDYEKGGKLCDQVPAWKNPKLNKASGDALTDSGQGECLKRELCARY